MDMVNIINPQTGVRYEMIMNGIKIMESVTAGNKSLCPREIINDKMYDLIIAIMHHQLSA